MSKDATPKQAKEPKEQLWTCAVWPFRRQNLIMEYSGPISTDYDKKPERSGGEVAAAI